MLSTDARRDRRAARARRVRFLALALSAQWWATACTTFAPARPTEVVPGARVRVQLTEQGMRTLGPTLGGEVRAVEGAWLGARGDSALLRVERLHTTTGLTLPWSGGAVTIAPDALRGLERSRVSRSRTALIVAGAVALGAALVRAVRAGGRAAGGGDGGPTPI